MFSVRRHVLQEPSGHRERQVSPEAAVRRCHSTEIWSAHLDQLYTVGQALNLL